MAQQPLHLARSLPGLDPGASSMRTEASSGETPAVMPARHVARIGVDKRGRGTIVASRCMNSSVRLR